MYWWYSLKPEGQPHAHHQGTGQRRHGSAYRRAYCCRRPGRRRCPAGGLDRGSLAQILEIYSHADSDELKLLQQIGYQPTFYALPETTGEIQVALSLSGQQTPAATPAPKPLQTLSLASHLRTSLPTARVYAAPVNADLTNRYGFQANAAAKIQFKTCRYRRRARPAISVLPPT
ncbi:hypothetical protein ULF88_09505 [Halopseudomonas pachastrellae]|nr:hypothetical protein [Halopseudomonas pachastrellae]